MVKIQKPIELKIASPHFRPSREEQRVKSIGEIDQGEVFEKLPEPPEELKKEGKKAWATIGKKLVRSGQLTDVCIEAFIELCKTYDDEKVENDTIEIQGSTYEVEGEYRKHPSVGIRERILQRRSNLMKEFGLTPVSRLRVPAAKQPKDGNTSGITIRKRKA